MTISILMYFTGYDLEKREVYVPRDREVSLMKALVQWYKKSNKTLIIEALKKANRQDLLGFFLD